MRAPMVRTVTRSTPPLAAATDAQHIVARAPYDGTITAVTYTPTSSQAGADTNTRTISVRNTGAADSKNVTVANLPLTAGTNLTARYTVTVPITGNPAVTKGEVLSLLSDATGTGIPDPGGHIAIEITRTP